MIDAVLRSWREARAAARPPARCSMWEPVIDRLRRASRSTGCEIPVVAPTLYPLGDSVEAWAAAVLELAGGGPLVVVGSSIGGSCAIEVARIAPDRVRALVLADTKAGHRPEPVVATRSSPSSPARESRRHGPSTGRRASHRMLNARSSSTHIASRSTKRSTISSAVFVRSTDGPIDRMTSSRSTSRSSWRVASTTPFPADPERVAARLRQGTFVEVTGAGHHLALERPAELVAIVSRVLAVASRP